MGVRVARWIARAGVLVLLGVVGVAGLGLVRQGLAVDVYRHRLDALAADYASLHERYDALVRKTAVTELRVADGTLSVVVRTADGTLREIPTPYDPSGEIYVDYVVVDGRLWIRRLFAEDTPPRRGIVVDPAWVDVDWDAEGAVHGKAAYRTLGEGRWVVTVTGGGALGLARAEDDGPVELAPPPRLGRFGPVESRVADRLGEIRPGEVLRVLAAALGDAFRSAPAPAGATEAGG